MSDTTDTKVLTWAETAAMLRSELAERKTIEFERGGRLAVFTIKRLTQREDDAARAKVTMRATRNAEAEVPMNAGEVNAARVMYGVVSGPEGFDPRNMAHIEALPVEWRDELARCIEEFSALDEVTRVKFR